MPTDITTTSTAPAADQAAMEAQLRQLAQRSDDGQELTPEDLQPASPAKPDDKTSKAQAQDNLEPGKTAPTEGASTQTGTDLPPAKDGKPAKDSSKAADQPAKEQPSDYAKARAKMEAERVRLDNSWKELQAARTALQAERAALARPPPAQNPPAARDEYTPEQYEAAAQRWRAEGKFDLADAAEAKAADLRRAPAQPAAAAAAYTPPAAGQPPEETPGTPAFLEAWKANRTKAEGEHPDLKNPESDLYKATAALIQTVPILSRFNDGIGAAAVVAKLQLEARSVPELKKRLAEQDQELTRLRKATSPSGGAPERSPAAKTFETMSPAEQEAEIKRRAEEADAA